MFSLMGGQGFVCPLGGGSGPGHLGRGGWALDRFIPVGRYVLEGIDRLVFPLPGGCPVCGREGIFPTYVCTSCLREWRRELQRSCPRCGRPGAGGLCPECEHGTVPWGRVRPAGVYRGALRELICRFKYGGERWLGAPLGEIVAGVGLATLPRPDSVVPVPLTAGRYRQRGFNQAEDLARAVGRHWHVPVIRALGRRRTGRRQAGLNRAARWENLAGTFVPLLDLRGATIILVDDVMTTGATLAYCTLALRQAGAARVDGLVLATVPGDERCPADAGDA
ncbi:MAG: ComF family protein [Bacillota bacterium]|nr:ComF family protein [Bacillota bacterium]